jgi:hypothetical protein
MPIPIAAAIGGVHALTGLFQGIFSGGRKAKNEVDAQVKNSPIYKQNQSILDYYDTSLARYGVDPTSSAMYKRQMQNVGRGTATGINALQDRRSGQAGISSLVRNANDASLNAEVAAENERSNRFGVLGQATGMKAAEDREAFQQNQVRPWELRTNLALSKLKGAQDRKNASMQNMFNGLQTIGAAFDTTGGGRRNKISTGSSLGAAGQAMDQDTWNMGFPG